MSTIKNNQTPNEPEKITNNELLGKKRKPDDSVDALRGNEPQGGLPIFDGCAARFFVIEAVNEHSLRKLSPFVIEKYLRCRIGSVKSAKKLQSGSLLIEVASSTQADCITCMDTFAEVPVRVTTHRTLNTSRGIIRCRDLRDCDDGEVLSELKSAGVVAVKHIFATRDGMKEPTNTFILTFGTPELPSSIKVGFLRLPVERFIPNPLRCFKCQRYGHGKSTCKRPTTCARCGQEGHEDATCSLPVHCVNCSGDHPAYSRQCPQWQRQLEITKVKIEKNIPFREAEEVVRRRSPATTNPASGSTYASVATPTRHSQLVSAGTQTDLTWPSDTPTPIPYNAPSHATLQNTATGSQTEPCAPPPPSNIPIASQQIPRPTASLQARSNVTSKPHPGINNNVITDSKPSKTDSNNRVNQSGRLRKGSEDPVKLHNRYGSLGEMGSMEVDPHSRPVSRINLK